MIESGARKSRLQCHEPQSGEQPEIVIFDSDPWDTERAIS